MKKLNILMVHPHDIYSASEPWTIRITSIAHEFVKMGHKVKLVYFPLPKKDRGKLRTKKITEFETIPFNRSKWYLFKNMKKMSKIGKWADIVHFQKCFSIASFPSIYAAYKNNKHLHYDWDDWEYGIYMWSPPSKIYGAYLNILEKNIIKFVDTLSVASDELKHMAVNLGFPKDKIVKVNVCADLKRFNPKNKPENFLERFNLKKPLVLYLGQLHGAQYAELFIKSAKIVLEKNPKANFVIVGGGSDANRLKHITESLGLGKKIIFTGFVEDHEVNQALAGADIAVACFADTKQVKCKSPLKIAEYLASGKAIVASDVGEVPWMLGGTGKLTQPGSISSLARGINDLLENEKIRKSMEINARKRAEELFDWKVVSEKLLQKYY